jgi:HEPN domain-containing protein
MKSPRDHAQGLLEKASHDLVAARAVLATGQALDTVCFHAQQAAEKSLKALLASKDVVYPWHHDLGELLKLALGHFAPIGSMENDLLLLSPYAVEVRYDETIRPDVNEAQTALDIASRMYALAEQLIKQTDSQES